MVNLKWAATGRHELDMFDLTWGGWLAFCVAPFCGICSVNWVRLVKGRSPATLKT